MGVAEALALAAGAEDVDGAVGGGGLADEGFDKFGADVEGEGGGGGVFSVEEKLFKAHGWRERGICNCKKYFGR